jgi:hypothetical protein
MFTIAHADFSPLKVKFIIPKQGYFVNKIAWLLHITRLKSLGYFGGILMKSF